jgi:hypothetical protein
MRYCPQFTRACGRRVDFRFLAIAFRARSAKAQFTLQNAGNSIAPT